MAGLDRMRTPLRVFALISGGLSVAFGTVVLVPAPADAAAAPPCAEGAFRAEADGGFSKCVAAKWVKFSCPPGTRSRQVTPTTVVCEPKSAQTTTAPPTTAPPPPAGGPGR
jgi:hypothetical protein